MSLAFPKVETEVDISLLTCEFVNVLEIGYFN